MGKLTVFNFITLNGFFRGPGGDIGWHGHGAEENEYAASNLGSGNILLFGRVTYEMMAGYWPTPEAAANTPEVAAGMNAAEKIVFSRTLGEAAWNNTRVVRDDIEGEIREMKRLRDRNMTLLGSGSIVALLADLGLVDEYEIMVDPVVIAAGKQIFGGITRRIDLRLLEARAFGSGAVLLRYIPA